MKRAAVLLLGPDRVTIGGVQTHLNVLLDSGLAQRFDMAQFQVGSAGRGENVLGLVARLLTSPFLLAAAIVRSGAGVVHVNTSLDARAYWRDLLYVLAAKLCGVRVIYQVHGGSVSLLAGSNPLRSAFMRRVLRATLQWPDVVVVLSRSELQGISATVPRQNVVLLPNAIDCRPFLEQGRVARHPGAPLRLVYVGRLVRMKGVFEMMQALALARQRGVASQLVVAGEGPEEAALRHAARELGIEGQVTFAGPAFGERKAGLLAEADVFLLPSYREGLPYALLEAMAAGVVPVATRVGAIPDVVADGVHGVLVPSRDPNAIAQAIAALAADRALVARMSAAGRARVASAYSIERLANDFTALYTRLGASATPRTAS